MELYKASSIEKANVCAMTTLYNSRFASIDNIRTYCNQVDKVYVIDNSEQQDLQLLSKINEISNSDYIHNGGNKGVANALNTACIAAIRDGYSYILTMDDDSQATEGMIKQMREFLAQREDRGSIGILCAQSDPNLFDDRVKQIWYTITAGSLVNLKAYDNVGPFQDDLFIDAVDHEFCFRLYRQGYKIVTINYLRISHSIGAFKNLSFFGYKIYSWSSHSPLRNYYMLRNFLYVLTKYRKTIPTKTSLMITYALCKIFLINSFLEDDTAVRFKYIKKAIVDFKRGQLGEFKGL